MQYLCFINVNQAVLNSGAIMMVFLHLYHLLLQWIFTMFRLYQAHLVGLRSQFCDPYVWFYSECGQSVSWLLTSGDSLSLPTSSPNSQRNALSGKYLFKNLKNMNFWSWTTFQSRSYMLENLILFLWELWWDYKNLTLYMKKLCVWEFVIHEGVRVTLL